MEFELAFNRTDDFQPERDLAQGSDLDRGSLDVAGERLSRPIAWLPQPPDTRSSKFELSVGKDSAEPILHVERNPNPPGTKFEPSAKGGYAEPVLHVKRSPDPPPLEFDISDASDETELEKSINRHYDHYVHGLPQSPRSFGRPLKQSLKPQVPDVSQGLGQRQAKKDIVILAKYVAASLILMVYRDELYEFKPPCWRLLKKREACTKILEVLDADEVNGCLVDSDAMTIYRRLLIEPSLQHPKELDPPSGTINFTDGTYNILERSFYAHRPEDEFTNFVNVAWDDVCSSTEGETFEAFVESSGGGNPLVRQQLLELVALALTGKQLKYFYVMLGHSHTGKTQFGRFLEELVGRSNVESISGIEDLGTQWTSGEIADCRLVTCLDLSNKPIPEAALTELKRLVGDDSVKGRKKYKDSFTYYRKPLVLFAGNYPLHIPHISQEEAFLNRMVVIPFTNPRNEENMVHHLYKELLQESSYIVREAIYAFEALAARNYQVTRSEIPVEFQPEDGRRAVRDITKFVQMCCEFSMEQETSTADLWDAYCRYIEGRNSAALSQIDFSRNLAQVLEDIEEIRQLKRVNGSDSRGYRGIALKIPLER